MSKLTPDQKDRVFQACQVDDQDESLTQVINEVAEDQLNFRISAELFKKEYPDVWGDPLGRARAQQLDEHYANQFPDADYAIRMRAVGMHVRRERDGEHDQIAREGMAEITKWRRKSNVELEEANASADDAAMAQLQAVNQDYEESHDEAIAQMRANRFAERARLADKTA